MAEQEKPYPIRLENRLNELQQDIKDQTKQLTELGSDVKHYIKVSDDNSKKIEVLEEIVQQDIGIKKFLKISINVLGGSIIAFFTWVVSQNYATQQRISDSNQRIAVIENRVLNVEDDVSKLTGQIGDKKYYVK